MAEQSLLLRAFAARRAATGAVTAGLLNAAVIHFSLGDLAEVSIFALVAEHWKQSLIGALVPRAVLISLLVAIVTVWATVKSRAAGEVQPPIDRNVAWSGPTLKRGLYRSVFAGGLAYLMSCTAVLLTGRRQEAPGAR